MRLPLQNGLHITTNCVYRGALKNRTQPSITSHVPNSVQLMSENKKCTNPQVQLGVTTFITSINLYVLKVTVWALFFICSLFKTTPIALLPFTTSYSGRVTITTKKNLQKRVIYLADTHTHTHILESINIKLTHVGIRI